jgi:hypothetical protein
VASRPYRPYASGVPSKTAAGNEATVPKKRRRRLFPID